MPHGGKGSASRRADAYEARREERQDLLRAMQPARSHEARTGKIVAHGAGRLAPISSWAEREADVLHPRLLAREGLLRCLVCGFPVTVEDFDTIGAARHPSCQPHAGRDTRGYAVEVRQAPPVLPQVEWNVEPGTCRVFARIGSRKVPLRAGDGSPMRADLYPSTIALEVSAFAAADRLRAREALRLLTQWLHQPADLVTAAFADLAATAARRPGGEAAPVLEFWSLSLTAASLNTLQALVPHASESQWSELIELAAAAAADVSRS